MADIYSQNESLLKLEEELNKITSINRWVAEVKNIADEVVLESKEIISSSKTMVRDALESNTKLNSSAQELLKAVEELESRIAKVDFPARLAKIDDSITGISINVANVHSGLNSLERNLRDEFQNKIKDILYEQERNKEQLGKKLSVIKWLMISFSLFQFMLITYLITTM